MRPFLLYICVIWLQHELVPTACVPRVQSGLSAYKVRRLVLHKKICLLSVCKCVLDKLNKTSEGLSRSDQLLKHDEALYSMRSIGDKLSCRINEKNKLR